MRWKHGRVERTIWYGRCMILLVYCSFRTTTPVWLLIWSRTAATQAASRPEGIRSTDEQRTCEKGRSDDHIQYSTTVGTARVRTHEAYEYTFYGVEPRWPTYEVHGTAERYVRTQSTEGSIIKGRWRKLVPAYTVVVHHINKGVHDGWRVAWAAEIFTPGFEP